MACFCLFLLRRELLRSLTVFQDYFKANQIARSGDDANVFHGKIKFVLDQQSAYFKLTVILSQKSHWKWKILRL